MDMEHVGPQPASTPLPTGTDLTPVSVSPGEADCCASPLATTALDEEVALGQVERAAQRAWWRDQFGVAVDSAASLIESTVPLQTHPSAVEVLSEGCNGESVTEVRTWLRCAAQTNAAGKEPSTTWNAQSYRKATLPTVQNAMMTCPSKIAAAPSRLRSATRLRSHRDPSAGGLTASSAGSSSLHTKTPSRRSETAAGAPLPPPSFLPRTFERAATRREARLVFEAGLRQHQQLRQHRKDISTSRGVPLRPTAGPLPKTLPAVSSFPSPLLVSTVGARGKSAAPNNVAAELRFVADTHYHVRRVRGLWERWRHRARSSKKLGEEAAAAWRASATRLQNCQATYREAILSSEATAWEPLRSSIEEMSRQQAALVSGSRNHVVLCRWYFMRWMGFHRECEVQRQAHRYQQQLWECAQQVLDSLRHKSAPHRGRCALSSSPDS